MMNGILSILNGNKVLWAVTMLIFNVGSRFVLADISEGLGERLLTTAVFKRLVVFSMFFVATRDFALSIVLAVAFVLVFNVLLRPDVDMWCLVPKSSRCKASRPIPPPPSPPSQHGRSRSSDVDAPRRRSPPAPSSTSSSAAGNKQKKEEEETFVPDEIDDADPPPPEGRGGTMFGEVVTSLAFAPL